MSPRGLRTRAELTLFAIALGSLLTPSLASAQACEEGRVVSPATEGRCCWPGQRWDDVGGRCEGPPSCPPTLVASGDECVPRLDAVPTGGAVPIVVEARRAAQLASPAVPVVHVSSTALRERAPRQRGVLAGGTFMFTAAWSVSVAWTTMYALSTADDRAWAGLSLAPVVGPLAWLATLSENTLESSLVWAYALLTSTHQLAGLVMMIAGGIRHPRTPRSGDVALRGAALSVVF